MPSDTRTLRQAPADASNLPTRTMPLPALARSNATGIASDESVHPDPRLIFKKTDAGMQAIRIRSQRVSLAARRLLMLFDGERSLAQLPDIVRPADMPTLLKELQTHGMITLAGILTEESIPASLHPDIRLARIKRSLGGVFEQELGPQASVLEARVQDCVNLVVLRNVLREVIALVAHRKNDSAADRIAMIVKSHGPF